MNKIILFFIAGLIAVSCTKENFIDTGLANGNHDCSMLEYMRNEGRNWDSTVVLIEHAGLEKLFNGEDPEYPKFTFFGPTNSSVLRYLLENDIERIQDMDAGECREMLLQYVLDDVILAKDVPRGTKTRPWPPIPGEGGKAITTVGGMTCRLFAQTEDYEDVTEAGATYIYLESGVAPFGLKTTDVASSDIRFTNGVIHSLHYNHTFGNL